MPLSMVTPGCTENIKYINGKDDVKKFLENIGFVMGSEITIISENMGNLIVNVKGARVAISKAMASRIIV